MRDGIDATIAASFVSDPKQSKVADVIALPKPQCADKTWGKLAMGMGIGRTCRYQTSR